MTAFFNSEALRSVLPTLESIVESFSKDDFSVLDNQADLQSQLRAYTSFYRIDEVLRSLDSRLLIGTFNHQPLGRVAVHIYEPLGRKVCATAYIVHGYFDHMGIYRHLVECLLEQNIRVIGIDLPGHGLSDGARASINDFEEYCGAVAEMVDLSADLQTGEVFYLGQSTGSALLMTLALTSPSLHSIDRMILFAPLVRPTSWIKICTLHVLLNILRVKEVKRDKSISSNDPEFVNFVHNIDPLQHHFVPEPWVASMRRWERGFRSLAVSSAAPLVIQGECDTTVNWRFNLPVIRAKFKNASELILKNARHHLVNEEASIREEWKHAVVKQVSAWIQQGS